MGTIADKLNRLINTKKGIRQEINRAYNTEEVSTSDTFNSYIQKLEEHPFYVMRLIERSIENIKLSSITIIGNYAFYSCSNLTSVSFPNATSIGSHAFYSCSNLTSVSFPNATSIGSYAFEYCKGLTSVSFPKATSIGTNAFLNCGSLTTLYIGTELDTVCTLSNMDAIPSNVTNIYVPYSLVDSYKSATNWSSYANKIKSYEQPVECVTLSITADDVVGNKTSTTIYYTAECTYTKEGVLQEGTKIFTGKGVSESFAQNTSTTNTVQRTVSFTYLGKTATTTITQGVWNNKYISVTTSGIADYGWIVADSKYNVDGYDAYMSNNVGIDNSNAVMRIECTGYTNLTIYIRTYSESYGDYTIASKANASTYPTSYSSPYVERSTDESSNPGTTLSDYTAVNYTKLSGNDVIYIVYTKDDSYAEGDDRGYLLIPKQS